MAGSIDCIVAGCKFTGVNHPKTGKLFERRLHHHRINFSHCRDGRVHFAHYSRTNPQFLRPDTSFLDKKLAGFQSDIFDHHGYIDCIFDHTGLCCPGARCKKIWCLETRFVGIGDRYDYRHIFYSPLGHDRGCLYRRLSGGASIRKIGRKSPACWMGHTDWKCTWNRSETGFHCCCPFLLSQGNVLKYELHHIPQPYLSLTFNRHLFSFLKTIVLGLCSGNCINTYIKRKGGSRFAERSRKMV